MNPLETLRHHVTGAIERGEKTAIIAVELCTNCGATLDPARTGRAMATDGKREFCGPCSGYADALAIGARKPVFLYENGSQVTSWMGVHLGIVTRRTEPRRVYGMRGAVRFQVRMLDGSMWYGTGPTDNGTYMRLRPYKNQ